MQGIVAGATSISFCYVGVQFLMFMGGGQMQGKGFWLMMMLAYLVAVKLWLA